MLRTTGNGKIFLKSIETKIIATPARIKYSHNPTLTDLLRKTAIRNTVLQEIATPNIIQKQ
jgi:hypothetical protein